MHKDTLISKRYKINRLIGQGGMADVYLAYDILLERDVAIKILRQQLSNDAVSLLRFKHEAVAVSKLSHPNIIEIFDIGEYDSRQYIVMEYVDGKTLKQLIVERDGLYKEEVVSIMKQLTSAIAQAHKHHIIHRDIKPQNILVKSDGSVIITDFGIALAQNALHLTQKETVMGSVHYLAPELARGEKATYQSDIYALGIVFYELLSGSVPYVGESAIQIAMKHINDEMPSIREFNPSIPQSIENIIIKSTYKNRELRYKSVSSMLDDLETALDKSRVNEPKLASVVSSTHSDTTKVIETLEHINKPVNKNNKKRNIIIGVVALILSVVAIVLMLPKEEPIEELMVPNIVGLSLEEAREKLHEEGFIIGGLTRELDEEIDVNHIISQTPKAFEKAEKGSEVNLVVSEGKYFFFEDYVGRNFESVRVELENRLNITIRPEYITDANLKAGEIVSQSIAKGSKLNPNNSVDVKFVVVKPIEFMIPSSVYGMEIQSAKALLEEMGASVKLEAITEGSPEFLASQVFNRVEYTNPTRNSRYVQSENSYIIIYYYEEVEMPEIPDPIVPDDDDEKGDD